LIPILLLLAMNTAWPHVPEPHNPCSLYDYQWSHSLVRRGELPQKLSDRIRSKLDTAGRKALGIKSNSIAQAVKQLDIAMDLLRKADLQEVPPDTAAQVKSGIESYRNCLQKAPPVKHATIRLLVRRYISGGATIPVRGANVSVELEHAGITAKDGSLTLTIAADRKVQINTDDGNAFGGGTFVTAAAGATKRVTIVMGEGGELPFAEPNELTLDEVRDEGILPFDFSTFTLRFLDDEDRTVAITDLGNVMLGEGTELDQSLFKVTPRGSIVATNPELVRKALLASPRLSSIWVTAYDGKGRTFNNRVQFEVGRNRLSGYLIAMPPAPKVDIGNASIRLSTQAGSVYRRRSDARGQFDFSYIPSGIVHFKATRMVGDVEYKALADIHMDGDMRDVILSMDRQAK
jgi:hypothetical protein